MRVLATVALIVVLLEAVLALAFFVGYWWLGGWQPGLMLLGAALLLIVLPWVGNLEVDYDSDGHRTAVRLGWWGQVNLAMKPEREIRVRLLGIPWRKKMKAKETEEEQPEKPEPRRRHRERARSLMRMSLENFEDIARILPLGLHALNEIIWEARQVKVEVQSPTGNKFADAAIAGVVGHRGLRMLDLNCKATGERRVHVRYQIALLRGVLSMLYVIIQGRPWRLAASIRAAKKQEETEQGCIEPKEDD